MLFVSKGCIINIMKLLLEVFLMFFTESQKKDIKEWTLTIIWAIAIYLLVSIFIFSARVDGDSMNPTFTDGNFLFATRNYLTSEYDHGDVIVFNSSTLGKALIKRVIGVPGDTIKIEDQKVYVNGEEIKEDYINNPPLENLEIKVTDGNYLVMGDNRQNSLDRRYELVGLVSKQQIMGKVVVEVFPKPMIIN